VAVYFDDLFDGGGFEEGGGDALFDAEDDAVGGSYLLHRHVSWLSEVGVCLTPMAVEPSLMASREYSTWKRRPSGEKVLWGDVRGD
jgi:hypothetical protein